MASPILLHCYHLLPPFVVYIFSVDLHQNGSIFFLTNRLVSICGPGLRGCPLPGPCGFSQYISVAPITPFQSNRISYAKGDPDSTLPGNIKLMALTIGTILGCDPDFQVISRDFFTFARGAIGCPPAAIAFRRRMLNDARRPGIGAI